MRNARIASLVIAALVAGIVAGNAASGFAATSGSTASAEPTGLGLRLGNAMRDAGARLADIVAKLTGTTVEDVQEQRRAGTSFAAIAAKKDVSSDKVIETTLDLRKQVLDARVKAGTLSKEQADSAFERMTDRVKERVASTDAGCTGDGTSGRRKGGGPGAGGGRGMVGGGGRGAGRGAGGAAATGQ